MKKFRALVIDDDENIRRQALDAVTRQPNIEVFTASSLAQAEKLMLEEFFHVAVVDLQLIKGGRKDIGGQLALQRLHDIRPSCRRILLTQQFEKYRKELFRLLDPKLPLIDAAVDKVGFQRSFVKTLRDLAHEWESLPVVVHGIEDIFGRLDAQNIVGEKDIGGVRARPSRPELDYVLSSLFGQVGTTPAGDDEDSRPPRELHVRSILEGGKSRSVVALLQLGAHNGDNGLLTVVKVGPRVDAEEEMRRYHEYVRFRVSLHRRVELLSSALGDTLAAVCYSFAGHAPNKIEDLQTLLNRRDPEAFTRIDQLFGPGAQEWFSDQNSHEDEGKFFARAYNLDPLDLQDDVRQFVDKHAETYQGRVKGESLVLSGGSVPLPLHLGLGRFRNPYQSCVVHGDLNGSNVLVDGEGHVLLIDFRHTNRGPRSLDFCALQASVRLSTSALDDFRAKGPVSHYNWDRKLWSKPWDEDDSARARPDESPYWAQASEHLLRHAYRCLPALDPQEHAVTAMLYALRLFRVRQIGEQGRFRLLIWMGALAEVIGE